MTEKNKRRLEVVEHVEGFAGGRVTWQGNDGTACWVVVTVERPVRVQAAEDICRTCPQYVRGSFEVVAPAA